MAEIVVVVPFPLRRFTAGSAEVPVSGATVQEALQALAGDHPDLGRRILDQDGRPRRFARLLVNDVDIARLDGIATALEDGDRMSIVIPIAGG
jgi:molybdopterin converting factor small subunit